MWQFPYGVMLYHGGRTDFHSKRPKGDGFSFWYSVNPTKRFEIQNIGVDVGKIKFEVGDDLSCELYYIYSRLRLLSLVYALLYAPFLSND